MKTYDLTLRTKMRAESSALAKSWLSELVDLDACPDTVEIDAREESSEPSHGENHPAVLTMHAMSEAVQALRVDPALASDLDLGAAHDCVERAMHAFSEFYLLFIRQERTIEEQRIENIKLAREWAAEKTVSKKLEGINSRLVDQHNRARATAITCADQLRALPLTPESFMRPMGAEVSRLNGASSTLELAR